MGKTRLPTKVNIKKILKQIASLSKIARQKKWAFYLDSELDEFYFSPKIIPASALLFSIENDFSIYIDKNSNLQGFFIEYYNSNFVQHETAFKELSKLFTEEIDGLKTIPKKAKKKTKTFEDALKGKALSHLILEDYKSCFSFA